MHMGQQFNSEWLEGITSSTKCWQFFKINAVVLIAKDPKLTEHELNISSLWTTLTVLRASPGGTHTVTWRRFFSVSALTTAKTWKQAGCPAIPSGKLGRQHNCTSPHSSWLLLCIWDWEKSTRRDSVPSKHPIKWLLVHLLWCFPTTSLQLHTLLLGILILHELTNAVRIEGRVMSFFWNKLMSNLEYRLLYGKVTQQRCSPIAHLFHLTPLPHAFAHAACAMGSTPRTPRSAKEQKQNIC